MKALTKAELGSEVLLEIFDAERYLGGLDRRVGLGRLLASAFDFDVDNPSIIRLQKAECSRILDLDVVVSIVREYAAVKNPSLGESPCQRAKFLPGRGRWI
jgi:hypothetical protein